MDYSILEVSTRLFGVVPGGRGDKLGSKITGLVTDTLTYHGLLQKEIGVSKL